MAYGGNDRRVPLIHGEKMRNALRAHDVPVEWVVYGEEGHGFQIEENRFDFYRRVAAFLAVTSRGTDPAADGRRSRQSYERRK